VGQSPPRRLVPVGRRVFAVLSEVDGVAAATRVDEGAQIDLLIDRRDDVINVCEVKFADDQFVIDKQHARDLQRKLDVFRRATRTHKSLFLTMITTFGVRKNAYAADLVASEVTMEDLFWPLWDRCLVPNVLKAPNQ
jgi:uncharacterized protein